MRLNQESWPLPLFSVILLFSASCTHFRTTASTPTPSSQPARTTTKSDRDENEAVRHHAPWEPPDGPQARRAWFRARKRSALSLQDLQTRLGTALPAASTPSTSVNPFQWTFLGPQPMLIPNANALNGYGGSVLTLAIDPRNPSTVYAGTYVGKLWKTTNYGLTWQPLSDSGPLVEIASIAVDPVLPNTVYVLDAYSLYKSSDGGLKWAEAPLPSATGCFAYAFAVHPTTSGLWLASEVCDQTTPNYAAIYRSTNAGATWTQEQVVNAPGTGTAIFDQVQFNSGNGNHAYASGRIASNSNGIGAVSTVFDTSSDPGATWTNTTVTAAQLVTVSYSQDQFAASPSNPSTLT